MTDPITWALRERAPWPTIAAISWTQSYVVRETPAVYVVCRPKVYVESSVASYLTARLSRDPRKARWQQITRAWWELCRWQFDVYWSEEVEHEIKRGDPTAAHLRRRALARFECLEVDRKALTLAGALMKSGRLPPKAEQDARHLAIAATRNLDVLLTWNCAHLANHALTPTLMDICITEGYDCPQILTPEQIMGANIHEQRASS
jgi:hypothetical protein